MMRLMHAWKSLVWTVFIGFLLFLGAGMPVESGDIQSALVVSGLASFGLITKAWLPTATDYTDPNL